MTREVSYATVPTLWDRGTCLVLGSGPSLKRDDVHYAAERLDGVIAVNNSYRHIPDATALYAADGKWLKWHGGCVAEHVVERVTYPAFTGKYRYTLADVKYPGWQQLKKGPATGLATDRHVLATGWNGVYQSINLAIHFGATRIILLGVDMQGQSGAHDFGRHPDNSGPPYDACIAAFKTIVAPLKAAGVEVINCTRSTALTAFPCVRLEDALPSRQDRIAV